MFVRLLFTALFSCFLSLQAVAEEKIRLTNGEWPPYMSLQLKHHGLVSRIVTQAFALEGYEVQYGFFPWKRAFELARTGEWDGSIIWYKRESRLKDFLFSDPVIYDTGGFFYLKSTDFHWDRLEDLSKYRIGTVLGFSYGPEFDRLVGEGRLRVQAVPTDKMNFDKLFEGRVDAVAVNIEIGHYILHNDFAPKQADMITTHERFYTNGDPMYLIVPRTHPQADVILQVFNRGLKKLKANGLYDQYFLESRRGEYLLHE